MNYAVINNNEVIAIIGIFPTNYYQFDLVVPTDKAIVVGDTYENGKFYHEGVEVRDTNEECLGIISGEIAIEEESND